MSATDCAHKHGIPYRSFMRLKAELAAAPVAIQAPAAPPEPRVVVVTGDILDKARKGLELGIEYLANCAANLKAEGATPADMRAVGDSVVRVLATVVETLEHKRGKNAPSDEIASLSDDQLVQEAKRIAAARAAESKELEN